MSMTPSHTVRTAPNYKGAKKIKGGMRMISLSPKYCLLVTTAGIASAISSPLQAQAALPAAAPASASASGVTADAPETNGLQDIIVTAQRRSESQQKVPISIDVVTGKDAVKAGVIGTESLGNAVPALQFGRQSGIGATPFLRGVGTNTGAINVESPVAVYVDDVYIGAPTAAIFQFNNIDSVEVLKGPQGTLFGRNATGGVVNVHTAQPSHTEAVDVTAGYGSYNTYSGSLYANGGLTNTIAGNFAATGFDQTDGYGRLAYTGKDIYKSKNYALRGQLLWEPDADTKVRLAADYSRYNGDDGENPTVAPGTVGIGGATYPGRYRSTNDPADFSKNKSYGISLKASHDFGPVSLVSISGYRVTDLSVRLDSDGSLKGNPAIVDVATFQYNHAFSQEVQLLSNSKGPFSWIVGGFYYNVKAAVDPLTLSGVAFVALGGSSNTYSKQDTDSYSGFGEASYSLPIGTKLTLGLRYTNDNLRESVLLLSGTGANLAPGPFSQSKSFSKLTYRAILDQKITSDVLAYASYSRGYRSGSYNINSPTFAVGGVSTPAPVVSPEVLDAYEVGVKSELFDHHLRFNASAFLYNYNNLQINTLQNGTTLTLNAAKARIEGIDADLTFVPTHRLTFTAGASILDSKFTSFPSGPYYTPNPAVCTPVPTTTGTRTGGNTTCAADLSGNRTPRSPKFTGNIGATYTLPTEVGAFTLNANLYHNSGFFWEVDNRFRQPSYNLVSAALGWTSSNKKYELRVYARNLLNEYYYSYFSEGTLRDSGTPEMPRNYGVVGTVHL
jgi:iron complex outermembrane receptor protein